MAQHFLKVRTKNWVSCDLISRPISKDLIRINTPEGSKNSSKMWEFRSCKFIREGFQDKKGNCNIKPGRFNFYDPRNVAYLQALFLHHGTTTISLLPYMDVTVLSRVAKTVRGKKIHLSFSLCFYVHTDSCNSSDLDRQNKR